MFNLDDIQTLEGAFTSCFRSYLLRTLFGIVVWSVVLNELRNPALRWLKTVSSTNISMGHCNHSLSLDATIMVSKHCPIIGEHIVVLSIT